jgi:HAD superfamily hydrolase (TIGR01549 family)
MKAGARSAEAVLRLLQGENVGYFEGPIEDGAIYSRFDDSVCISSGENATIKGVIFDLDDTLYSEKEYVQSGYKKIEEYFKVDGVAEKLWKYFEEGKPAIDCLLSEIGHESEKNKCLRIYREQKPNIHLYDGVIEMIAGLHQSGIRVGIITDGRPEGQRNKIEALGLEKLVDDIIITDELGGVQFRKPNDISFRIMQNRWRIPFESIVYIGDNASKDFQAPKQLGMKSVFVKNKDGLYYDENADVGDVNVVENVKDILTLLDF